MDNEIVLSAKELYYLGKLMQARYIDCLLYTSPSPRDRG